MRRFKSLFPSLVSHIISTFSQIRAFLILNQKQMKLEWLFLFVRRLTFSSLIPFSLAVMSYFICTILGWVEPTAFWKLGLALGGRALSLTLWKFGLTGGLALAIGLGVRVLITVAASEIGVDPRMMAPGSDSGGNNDSGSWKKYLNLSSDSEGQGQEHGEAESASRKRSSDPREDVGPSSGRRRVDAPEPSTSSEWSGSWIEKWFNRGGTSSAPVDGQQPQGEVDQPIPAEGEGAPDPIELQEKIRKVFYAIRGRQTQSHVLQKLYDDLKLETASPQKRRQIVQLLEHMKGDETSKQRNLSLKTNLLVRIGDWEREQTK